MKGKGELLTYWLNDQDPSYKRFTPLENMDDSIDETFGMSAGLGNKALNKSFQSGSEFSTTTRSNNNVSAVGMNAVSSAAHNEGGGNGKTNCQSSTCLEEIPPAYNNSIDGYTLPDDDDTNPDEEPQPTDPLMPSDPSSVHVVNNDDHSDYAKTHNTNCSSAVSSSKTKPQTPNDTVPLHHTSNEKCNMIKRNSCGDSGISSHGNNSRNDTLQCEVYL